jgi:hypothetical protein
VSVAGRTTAIRRDAFPNAIQPYATLGLQRGKAVREPGGRARSVEGAHGRCRLHIGKLIQIAFALKLLRGKADRDPLLAGQRPQDERNGDRERR